MEFVKDKKKKDSPDASQDFNNSLLDEIKVDEEFEKNLNEIFRMSEETEGEEKQ